MGENHTALWSGFKPHGCRCDLLPSGMGKVWGTIDQVNADDLLLVASAWDTASKTGEKNDFTANVVIGRLRTGGFVVLDVRGGGFKTHKPGTDGMNRKLWKCGF